MRIRGDLRILTIACITLLIVPVFSLQAFAGEPTEQVRTTIEKVRDLFKDKELKKPSKRQERLDKVKEVVAARFNFEEMSKRTLALHWRKRTPEERKEFVGLYSDLIENTYLRKIEKYEEEDIEKHADDKVVYLDEKIDGQYAAVKTEIITRTGVKIPVDYRLLKDDGEWKAYDVIIEGVSLINNYRKQFNEIIRSGSYEELVKRIRDKVREDS